MNLTQMKRIVMEGIYENRMLLTAKRDKPEGWILISGIWSPFYIQLRLISSYPDVLSKAAQAMTLLLREQAPHVNKLVGIAFAGIPIATAISLKSGIPSCHTRKVTKSIEELRQALSEYGQHSLVEGVLEDGDAICLVDDLVTGLTSKIVARDQIRIEIERRGLSDVRVNDIAVIVDRQQGAKDRAAKEGIDLHALIQLVDEGLPLIEPIMDEEEYKTIIDYLQKQT